jgi:hypothetical protein
MWRPSFQQRKAVSQRVNGKKISSFRSLPIHLSICLLSLSIVIIIYVLIQSCVVMYRWARKEWQEKVASIRSSNAAEAKTSSNELS